MRWLEQNWKRGWPLLVGLAALLVPLVRDFHFESALLAALAGTFGAGWLAAGKPEGDSDKRRVAKVARKVYLAGLPLLIYSLASGCFSTDGLGFWLLYPLPGILFGYAIGRFIRRLSLPWPRRLTVLVLLAVAVGDLLFEFFHLPQVYFFNHVWGGWPGPIYDEAVHVGGSLLYFRMITLLWVTVLWYLPDWKAQKENRRILVMAGLALLFSYFQLADMGIISPRSYLQKRLGGYRTTDHFELYFDRQHYSMDEIHRIGDKLEFYYAQVADSLQLDRQAPQPIEAYLYAHPWQKKELVGAKYTSYVPVWLDQDQLHIAKQQIPSSLKHELVHVMAKRFGNPVLHASWSIGLVEGLAVALSPDESPTSTIDQIVAADRPLPQPAELKDAFSIWGFYGGRATVNYTTTGSFVRWLLRRYGPDPLKQAYRHSDIAGAYPKPFDELARGWLGMLDTVRVDSVDRRVSSRLFGQLSIFEKPCPHTVSASYAAWDGFQHSLAEGDTTLALDYLDRAKELAPHDAGVWSAWGFFRLRRGDYRAVIDDSVSIDSSAIHSLLKADALFMEGRYGEARRALRPVQRLESQQPDTLLATALSLRDDSLQWARHVDIVLRDSLFAPEVFDKMNGWNQLRALQKAVEKEKWPRFTAYARRLEQGAVQERWFDSYMLTVDYLAWLRRNGLARQLLDRVAELSLRPRYRERLQQKRAWNAFIDSRSHDRSQ